MLQESREYADGMFRYSDHTYIVLTLQKLVQKFTQKTTIQTTRAMMKLIRQGDQSFQDEHGS